MIFFLPIWPRPRPAPIRVKPKIGSQSAYSGRQPFRKGGSTNDVIAAVVETVKFAVADPLAGTATDVGLSEQVGAKAGVGETEQVNDTEPLNPYIGDTATLNVAELPEFNVPLAGVVFIAKLGPFTTCTKLTVCGLKLLSPLYTAEML
jgi:hypothetical protein